MGIKVAISDRKVINSSLTETNRIRLSSPAIAIKPSIFLSDLTDINTVDASDDDALIFEFSSRNFRPTDITDIRENITKVDKLVGGFF